MGAGEQSDQVQAVGRLTGLRTASIGGGIAIRTMGLVRAGVVGWGARPVSGSLERAPVEEPIASA